MSLVEPSLAEPARVRLRGDVDLANADQLRDEMLAVAAATDGVLVCDCTELTFLDSSGIAALVGVSQRLRASGRDLRVENLPPGPRRTLEVAGLLPYFGLG